MIHRLGLNKLLVERSVYRAANSIWDALRVPLSKTRRREIRKAKWELWQD